ncbi:MAG TPA: ribonuclease Z [Candidatus Nanoarchaeia archaeon]|nr:ribonuclease Z [Candidatus Nanoarchaeia archaeon]
MEIVFLGTSSMVPTKERNHSSIIIIFDGDGTLVDCGEGTQRQLKIAGIKPSVVSRILISHWHGDHVLGLPGLISTLSATEYAKPLEIYGPKDTAKRMELMENVFVFDRKIELTVKEVERGIVMETKKYYIETLPLEHNVPCQGYNFIEKDRRKINLKAAKKLGIPEGPLLGKLQDGMEIEFRGKKIKPDEVTEIVKGKKITLIADTIPTANATILAQDADILICESTYASDMADKAEKHAHMTAKQAAQIANVANVKKLFLTHFSARYTTPGILEEDAKDIFSNTEAAYDFKRVRL